ncbi:MAG TPA: NAD(P)/FAD-dependent oxidoreductase [Firmicutes bacterium]|nr:NAD(P)/FAD-dependent oxidoreductase [Bacillota bacterium]
MPGLSTEYLIVGNSVAAIGAIEAIRELDSGGSIVLISDEGFPVYSRPLISQYLTGERDLDGILYRSRDFYRRMNVNAILGVRVTGVDYPARVVSTASGDEIHYKKLLLATGARPALPPISGIDLPGVFTFTTLADAIQIREYLPRVRDVVIVGGGLIGLQAAEALARLDLKVSVVEFMPRILSPVLDQAASDIVASLFSQNGVDILTSKAASEIVAGPAGSAGAVVLKDGTALPCDMVIVATGVSPRIDLAKPDAGDSCSHPATGRGIFVNGRMETTMPGVYAAGDVAIGMDLLTGAARAIPIWPNAYLQGRIAGLNMAGKPTAFRGGLAMNAFHFFGLPAVSAGIFDPPKESEPGTKWEILYELKPDMRFYRKLVLRDNKVVGMIGIGAGVERAGVIVGCMANQINCESFKVGLLRDPGIGLFPGPIRRGMILGQVGAGWWRSEEAGAV